ncbi:MAG: hypothetical protein L3J17_01080 [Candidatus Jettenia sp.]|nr:MAG: hypothetical protein L3J17_01080 [Candidatus Jettenia sp.]
MVSYSIDTLARNTPVIFISVILHYDGKTWNHMFHGFDMWLNDIYEFGDNDIFVVGERGTILHCATIT